MTTNKSKTEIYEAAIKYLEAGMSVIPLQQGSKVPAISWKEYQRRKPTKEELKDWFLDSNNNYNLGIVTGKVSNLYVIDIDNYKGTTESLPVKALTLPATEVQARTPSGGLHWYYRVVGNEALQNFQGGEDHQWIDGRGEGGYVVAPPSEVEGKSYEWIVKNKWGKIKAKDLQGFLGKEEKEENDNKNKTSDDAADLFNKVLTDGFTKGKHNEELHTLTRYLARTMGATAHGRKLAYDILLDLDLKDDTPQSATGNFDPTFNAAWEYEERRLGTKDKVSNKDNDFNDAKVLTQQFMGVVSFDRFYQEYKDYEVRYLIEEMLPEGSIILLAGAPETYKSWVALAMGVKVALGDKGGLFLDYFGGKEEAEPVLIFQQEDNHGATASRLEGIIGHTVREGGYEWQYLYDEETQELSFETPAGLPLYIHPNAELDLTNPDSIKFLDKRIEETGAKLIIIDPLYTIMPSGDGYFQEFGMLLKQSLKRLRNKYNCTFLIVHHNRKSGGNGREGIYGSVFVNAAAEGAIVITVTDDNKTLEFWRSGKMFEGQAVYHGLPEIKLNKAEPYESIFKWGIREVNVSFSGRHDERIYDYLKNKGADTISNIAKALDINRGTVSKRLSVMEEQDLVRKLRGNQWAAITEESF